MIHSIISNLPLILGVAVGISEALSLIPSVKANGIFQAIWNGLKWAKEKFGQAKAAEAPAAEQKPQA